MTHTIKRSGKTNQFIVELRDGADTMRCAIHIEGASGDAGGRDTAALEAEAFERALRLAAVFIETSGEQPHEPR